MMLTFSSFSCKQHRQDGSVVECELSAESEILRPNLGSLSKKYKTRFNRPPPTQTKSAKPVLEPEAT